MTTFNRVLSAALLSASLVAGTAGIAQAHGFDGINAYQPTSVRPATPLLQHRVLATENTVNGIKIIYGTETTPVAYIGPRDVSESALKAEAYVGNQHGVIVR
jgi:hypothetical protein